MRKSEDVRRHVTNSRAVAATAIAVALAFIVAAPAAGQDDLVPHVEKGRKTFVSICGKCHGIDKPETKNMERPAWDALISSMEANGAKMTGEERELILDYLGIRNIFLTKCTGCHTTDRILDKSQSFSGWEQTVERMRAMGSDLMAEGEARSIIAYLTVVRGEAPSAK
jgi:hypothetical protein